MYKFKLNYLRINSLKQNYINYLMLHYVNILAVVGKSIRLIA